MSKILVIEDETAVRENLIELLSEEGYEAIGAQDGEEGVQRIWEELPDLIICDIMMPKLDGYGVLARISRDVRLAGIPFVFLTARVAREDLRKGMEMGADDFITKPYKRREVLQAITTRLGRLRRLEIQTEKKLAEVRNRITTDLPHELMTPLSITIGFSEVLAEQVETLERDEIQKLAKDIHHSAHRLLHLVENSLLLAELWALNTDPEQNAAIALGQHAPPWHQHPPASGARRGMGQVSGTRSGIDVPLLEIIENKAQLAGRAGDLTAQVQPAQLSISEQYLEKILDEVLDNAFKFSKAGTQVRVEGILVPHLPPLAPAPTPAPLAPASTRFGCPKGYGAGVDAGEGKMLYRLRIGDHGRGMTAEQIRRINGLSPFDRHLYEQQGLGLGLVLVQQICLLVKGSLHIQSIPGEETLVEVFLPVQI